MNKECTYPYTAFVLTPSMKVKEVTIVGTGWHATFQNTENGETYHLSHVHSTREAAIAAGHAQLDAHAKRLEEQAATLDKLRATLNKQVAK